MREMSFSQRETEKTRSIYAERIGKDVSPSQIKKKEKHKGAATRRHKTSTGMRGSLAKDVGPHQHTSHARAALVSAHYEQRYIEVYVRLHRLKTNS